MPARRLTARRKARRTQKLFVFDEPYRLQYGVIAGVDEVGCGPLAGPVVAAAVILSHPCKLPRLNDSKLLSSEEREHLYPIIESSAVAVGVGIVEADEIDRINIRQAGFAAMRIALSRLAVHPNHVLIDGFRLPSGPPSQTHIVGGDALSAHIAAASVMAKVTRDRLMLALHDQYPQYGFHEHKGYCTRAHLEALKKFGPCPIHRLSYAPVNNSRRHVSKKHDDATPEAILR